MSFFEVVSAIGSIVLLLGIMVFTYYVTRWYARRMKGFGAGKLIRVVDRAALGDGASLGIIEVAGKYYLVGMSEKNIQLLKELEGFDPGAVPAQDTARPSFERFFRQSMEKFGRKKDDGASQ